MRLAARLLPLAATATALLGLGVGPALAADPACAPSAEGAALKDVTARSAAAAVPGEFVVRYRDAAGAKRGVKRLAEAGATGARSGRLAVVRLPRDGNLKAAAAALRSDPTVLWAEPNYVYRAARLPDDGMFGQQWALNNTGSGGGKVDADIDAPEAWNITTGSANVLVGVVDTGLDPSHPDLAPNLAVNPGESGGGRETNGIDDDGNGFVDDVRGWDVAGGDNDPRDTYGHGTHVAGIIGARGGDGRGTTGVAWQVGLLPVRALNDQGWGSSLDIATGMQYAAARGARVVTVSLGGAGYSQAMLDAICSAPDTLFVVAAGNTGENVDAQPFYPCAYAAENIVCVAATDMNDALASYSNRGVASVDLAAPGTQILSTLPGNTFGYYTGTSMATPHVAGAAALLLSRNPGWTVQQLKAALLGSVDPLPSLAGQVASGGRLNVGRAVATAGGPASAAVAVTEAAAAVTTTSATVAATVDAAGRSDATLRFEYGPTAALGASTTPQPLAATAGPVRLEEALTDLVPGTAYRVRALVATADGEVRGETVTFTTAAGPIAAVTGTASAAGPSMARLRGSITAGAAVTYRFEYGTTARYGRTTMRRRLAATTGPVTVDALASRLRPGTVYHYRLVATTRTGTVRGADRTIVVGRAALRVRRATKQGSRLRVSVRVPGPGRVTVTATGRKAGAVMTLGRTSAVVRSGGPRTLVVRLSSVTRRLQAAHGKISVTVTFTPSGARAAAGRTVLL